MGKKKKSKTMKWAIEYLVEYVQQRKSILGGIIMDKALC